MATHPNTIYSSPTLTCISRRKTNIKCLQLNLQHTQTATLNLAQIILQKNLGVAFVQEPYTAFNNVAGFPKSFRIFAHGNGRKRSAVIVNNNFIDAIAIKQVSNEDAILIEFSYEGLTFYGASLYFPIDRDIAGDFETVEEIIQLTKGKGLILSIDSNSRSTLWHDTSMNQRGKSLEEFIITSNLLIMNEPSDIPTFETTRERSWINLTLSNNILVHKIRGWTCGEEDSCADHKIMLFDTEAIQVGCNAKHYPGKRYFTRTEDWGPFVDKLATNLLANFNCRDCPNDLTKCDEELSNKVKQCSDTGETIHKFLSAVIAACDAAFKASRPGKRANKKRSVPWWSVCVRARARARACVVCVCEI